MANFSGQTAIVGAGDAQGGRKTGKSSFQLGAEAARAALHDAGIEKGEIDGLLCTNSAIDAHFMYAHIMGEYLGLEADFSATLELGGASAASLAVHAAAAIHAGLASTVLCINADNRSTGFRRRSSAEVRASSGRSGSVAESYEEPFGPFRAPGKYAMLAKRHMAEYGTTPAQFASVAVAERSHGLLNPISEIKEPLTVEQVLASPYIVEPLHKDEITMVSDWGGAVIVTSAQRARELRRDPVYLLGAGEGHRADGLSQISNLTDSPARRAAKRALGMAGVRPDDIDVAELYDCFVSCILVEIEDIGFCGKGESGPFVEAGNTRLGGRIPVNTHGGMLSCSSSWIGHTIEAVRQLRGECGPRQVPNAKLAVVSGNGGTMAAETVIVYGR